MVTTQRQADYTSQEALVQLINATSGLFAPAGLKLDGLIQTLTCRYQ